LRRYDAGTALVRFLCRTLDCQRTVEKTNGKFLGTGAALPYGRCLNANEALIPTVAGPEDVFISDELNHASIIDAMRLMRGTEKAIYKHGDLDDLESKLRQFAGKQTRWVVTDGVFSMEGDLAKLPQMVELCRGY